MQGMRWIAEILSGAVIFSSDARACSWPNKQKLPVQIEAGLLRICATPTASSRPPQKQSIDSEKGGREFPSRIDSPQRVVPPGISSAVSQNPQKTQVVPRSAGDEEIVVNSRPLRGSVIGKIPPEQTYSALEIQTYGADNLDSLLSTFGAQVSSNREQDERRPLVLLNGRRVSSFADIAKIPTEAIERMEVFPEEQALAYGFQPNQKVVNIVTFESFSSKIAQTSYGTSTEAGYNLIGGAATLLTIKNDLRFNLNAEVRKAGSLLEHEREILLPQGDIEASGYRTLTPSIQNAALSGILGGPVLNGVTGSISGRFESDRSTSLLGAVTGGQLTRDVSTKTIHLGTIINGLTGRWLWSMTGNLDRDDIDVQTENRSDIRLLDGTESLNESAAADVAANGPIFTLPTGTIGLSLRGGLGTRSFISKSRSSREPAPNRMSRDTRAIQGSLDIPLSAVRGGGAGIGRLSANLNARAESFSDFGTQITAGYGLYWTPVKRISVNVSSKTEERPPEIERLGNIRLETPNVRVFDFVTGRPVDLIQVSGGNKNLTAERAKTVSLGVYAKPFGTIDLTLSSNYVRMRIRNPISNLPIFTDGVEAAFPERFTRDDNGNLLQIDSRPLNFERSAQRRLRSGINFSKPLGKGPAPPPGTTVLGTQYYPNEAAMRAATPPGVTIIEVADGSDEAKRIEASASRLNFSIYHTWTLQDSIWVRSADLKFDLLNGSATSFLGGTPRHELQLQAAIFKKGLGVRITANWRSGSTVRNFATASLRSDNLLRFMNYSAVNLSIFLMPAQRFAGANHEAWLAGTRVTFDISNILNMRPKVVDGVGSTPLNYQGAYLDPIGRVISLGIRKKF